MHIFIHIYMHIYIYTYIQVRQELQEREQLAWENMQVRILERQEVLRRRQEEVKRRTDARAEQLLELEAHQKQYINRLREIKGDNDVYYYKQMERRARSQV
jgi:acetoin utilization deacetylase AcuC-like enzyme